MLIYVLFILSLDVEEDPMKNLVDFEPTSASVAGTYRERRNSGLLLLQAHILFAKTKLSLCVLCNLYHLLIEKCCLVVVVDSPVGAETDGSNIQYDASLNEKALDVIDRISSKLRGKDFKTPQPLEVKPQVQKLIEQATSTENLCQCYHGWCPFW